MTKRLLLLLSVLAFAAPQLIPQTPQQTGTPAAQPAGFGTIQGTIGRYTLYAWESVFPGAYQNAEFLARYAGRGVAVTVEAGARTTATATAIRDDASGR
jgi:hypothetical protein